MCGRQFARACLTIVVLLILMGGLVWLFRASRGPQTEIRNVVLISVDTCRADRLNCYGFGQKTTPHIDAVARDGVLFTRAHSTNPITLPAHSSMLTGTNPPYHGVHDNINYRLGDSNVTLAEILHEHGFQSAAFVGSYVLASRFGLDQGFDTYDDESPANSATIFFAERSAEDVSRRAREWLDDHGDEQFFLFVHYFDPHNPYSPPEPFAARYHGDAYAGEIAYTDDCIGQVIAKLKSLGIYDSTLLVITADHGESLGEHTETTHSYFIYQNTIRVPLIVKAPGVMQGATVDEPASIIDIVPTVLGLLGKRAPPPVQGADLSSFLFDPGKPMGDRYLYCESLVPTKYGCSPLRGLVHGKWKYIWTARPELYDLGRDPAEATNLIHDEPQIAQELDKRLREIVVEQGRTDVADSSLRLDRQSVERLKSLGYVGGSAMRTSLELDPNSEDPKDFVDTYVQLRKAHAYYAKRQFAEAQMECLEILNQRPRNQEAHMVLGVIALDEGRYADAVAHYSTYLAGLAKASDASSKQTVVRLDVEIAISHGNLGNALQSQGRFEEAVAHYKKALRLDPNNVEAHNNWGYALEALGRPQEAIAHYQDALRIKPEIAEVHYNWGKALAKLERFDEAIAHYQDALRIKPDLAEAQNNWGILLEALGRPQEAIAHYQDALRIKPEHAEAHYNWGKALQTLGRSQEAVAHYQEALRIKPDFAEAHNNSGVALAGVGRYEEAVAHYQEALRIMPRLADVHYLWGIALEALERPQEAVAHYQEALRINPDYAEAHYNWGNTLAALGRREEALARYRDAVRIDPDYAEAHNNWGAALLALGRFKEAATHYQAALRIRPDYTYAHNNLAWLRATCPDAINRDGGQALAHAKRAVQLAGDDHAGFLDSLSAAYAELGDFEEAVRWQRKAVQIASDEIKDDLAARLELYKRGQPYRESHGSAP